MGALDSLHVLGWECMKTRLCIGIAPIHESRIRSASRENNSILYISRRPEFHCHKTPKLCVEVQTADFSKQKGKVRAD